jgi:hypothetical protein
MKRHLKPRWNSLTILGLMMGMALLWQVRLPLSPAGHSWLLGLWVLLFYGATALWMAANREAMEQAPAPRDVIGRPIIDVDAPEPEQFAVKEPQTANQPLALPLRQSEAI